MTVDARGMTFGEINERLRTADEATVENCLGQRFIACGMGGKKITVNGTPGNALGAYLDGAEITVYGNAQDAVGDTMNDGRIIIHGSTGDATGYAMRGGEIYVRDSAGYRAGIHMKAYKEKLPVMVIGGSCGSFAGEYQAGGIIIVLGRRINVPIIGNFCGTGMHGGRIYLCCDEIGVHLPRQVKVRPAEKEDMEFISGYIKNYCMFFSDDYGEIARRHFFVLEPDSENPYKQLYVLN
jgi:glutamate synthase domain-containing protein 3